MKRTCTSLAFLIALFALTASAAWAGTKVQVCHIPPGNPANFHTITISENALQAHLGHGDLAGACFAHCDTLCSDGNACTIDACDASERCISTHPPVNCDDGSLCTTDSCNPASGCASVPKICTDADNCTVNSCDPLTGACVAPPVVCPAGEACNPSNGTCEGTAPPCPCTTIPGFNAVLANASSCFNTTRGTNDGYIQLFTSSSEAAGAGEPNYPGPFCSYSDNSTYIEFDLNSEQSTACVQLLRDAAVSRGLTCEGFPI